VNEYSPYEGHEEHEGKKIWVTAKKEKDLGFRSVGNRPVVTLTSATEDTKF
jgi:hypothetical protein